MISPSIDGFQTEEKRAYSNNLIVPVLILWYYTWSLKPFDKHNDMPVFQSKVWKTPVIW